MKVVIAALLYVALVFAAGFALGTVRTLVVAPRLGETGAVAVEVPVMLALSWLACGIAIRRTRLGPAIGERVAMGALAFALLMLAETLTGTLLLGRSLGQQAATYRTLPALLASPPSSSSPLSPSRACAHPRGSARVEASTSSTSGALSLAVQAPLA